MNSRRTAWLLAAVIFGCNCAAANAAVFSVINSDSPGEGFNDSTPATPVGGNSGTTLGQQRLNALQFAANLLGARLGSDVRIRIAAEFSPQQCSPGNATLAATGTSVLVSDFRNAPRSNTFYPIALANALAGRDLDDGPDIDATFNSSIDNNGLCLAGVDWYYGFDDSPPGNDLNFISTAVHELIHGLGFSSFASLTTGEFEQDVPDIYSVFILDTTLGPWPSLSPAERAVSARNDGNLVWDGANSQRAANTLSNGVNSNRVQLFAPSPLQSGSSVSHWDSDVNPNALMEPFDTGDVFVTQTGIGLATCLLEDIGWTLINNVGCPDGTPFSVADNAGSPGVIEGPPPPVNNANDVPSGGGGGCALTLVTRSGAGDPLLPLLVVLSFLLLYRRKV